MVRQMEMLFCIWAILVGFLKPIPIYSANGNGVTNRYFILFSDNGDHPYWVQIGFFYETLIHTYQIPPENIRLLYFNGENTWGDYPAANIYDEASRQTLSQAVYDIAAVADADDQVYFFMTGHGLGYEGDPQSKHYGRLNSHHVSVDPGDTHDYLEKDFQLASLYTNGVYEGNFGLDQMVVDIQPFYNRERYFRLKVVSTFDRLFFERDNLTASDNDIYLEYLYDYLLGDTNRDGYIDYTMNERADFDQDGIEPYEHATKQFDEDDWGALDFYDELRWGRDLSDELNTFYTFVDIGLDNQIDISINLNPSNPQSNGIDTNNDGLIDGIDVNQDGDMDDWVSVDESIDLNPEPELTDDEFKALVAQIHTGTVIVILEHCYSGGFIDDLSGSGLVILTAARETESSLQSMDGFITMVAAALRGERRNGDELNADENADGNVSLLEAFNFSSERNKVMGLPQYDDNGDGIGHTSPVPYGGDGSLGSITFLRDRQIFDERTYYLPVITR